MDHTTSISPSTLTLSLGLLKAHPQISKIWSFEKYCSCDQACQVSALLVTTWQSYLENLTIDDKFINKRVQLFIHQTMCQEFVKKKNC